MCHSQIHFPLPFRYQGKLRRKNHRSLPPTALPAFLDNFVYTDRGLPTLEGGNGTFAARPTTDPIGTLVDVELNTEPLRLRVLAGACGARVGVEIEPDEEGGRGYLISGGVGAVAYAGVALPPTLLPEPSTRLPRSLCLPPAPAPRVVALVVEDTFLLLIFGVVRLSNELVVASSSSLLSFSSSEDESRRRLERLYFLPDPRLL